MELTEYLWAMGRRFFVLGIVPIVAAWIGFFILNAQPTQFSATATVRLPVPIDAAASVITQANSDFTEALASSANTTATSQSTGVGSNALESDLTAAQSGGSRIVEVTFVTAHQAKAEGVVTTASRAALTDLLEPDVALKRKTVDDAQGQYDAARVALDKLTSATGVTMAAEQYRQKFAQVNQLQVQLLQAQSTNGTKDPLGHTIDNSKAIDTFNAAISATQAELNHLTTLISDARPAEDAVQNALANLGTAQRDLRAANVALASVDAPGTIVTSPVTQVDKAQQLLKTLAVIVAVAVVLAVALLVLLELLWPSSRRQERADESDEEAIPTPTPGEARGVRTPQSDSP